MQFLVGEATERQSELIGEHPCEHIQTRGSEEEIVPAEECPQTRPTWQEGPLTQVGMDDNPIKIFSQFQSIQVQRDLLKNLMRGSNLECVAPHPLDQTS